MIPLLRYVLWAVFIISSGTVAGNLLAMFLYDALGIGAPFSYLNDKRDAEQQAGQAALLMLTSALVLVWMRGVR